MTSRKLRLAACVLAAGAATRFSDEPGAKLLAELHGKPLLAHVLQVIRQYDPIPTVVVLGHGAEAIEHAIDWAGELRVHNPAPERGLASSVQAGIHALEALPGEFDGAFIVLGDQPRLRSDVMHALASAAEQARPADCPFVVPNYEQDADSRNPVLLLRPAWVLVDDLRGDRGFASLLAEQTAMLLNVRVPGTNADVDRLADLEALIDAGPTES